MNFFKVNTKIIPAVLISPKITGMSDNVTNLSGFVTRSPYPKTTAISPLQKESSRQSYSFFKTAPCRLFKNSFKSKSSLKNS